ncbi:hypothetical protein PV11_08826 [Exophiala sideris]|uniref:DNA (cytosine-5-)-methyltransferase n=1 Tax=Exophiala sideris TaxID=1016849 RepID=A0A0D1YPT6_9EURO|nr:hypothetical protein PV11_08826 [Exophiala sideris]
MRERRERRDGSERHPIDLTDKQILGPEHNRDVQLKDGTFMRVARISEVDDETWMIGRRLWIQNHLGLMMPEAGTQNELVWVSFCDNDANESDREVRVRAAEIHRFCKIVFTNVPHAYLNITQVRDAQDDLFFCRWQRMTTTERTAKGNQNMAGSIVPIDVADTDVTTIELWDGGSQNARVAPAELRRHFRGPSGCKPGGSSGSRRSAKYTFADFFCGAGGVSQGAVDAGLALRLALDANGDAIRTYHHNFNRPGLDIQSDDISNFINKHPAARGGLPIDIVHASPPCQPFSRANTTPNAANDAENLATFTTVRDIIEICKPRIMTLEEADGLTDDRHREWLQRLFSWFIEFGYSVQWRVVEMWRYGVPQRRRRLILIAAGPGETLPPFPAFTHGTDAGLLPPPTIAQAIEDIDDDVDDRLNDVSAVHHFPVPKPTLPRNGVSGTLTCNGGGGKVYHFDGLRKHTVRELLSLQTFPASFDFPGNVQGNLTSMRKQIGNAVPPAFSRALFATVVDWLKGEDARELFA